MKGRHGFTLMEVMIAAMLSGMIFLAALPFIRTGQRLIRKAAEEEMISMEGDAVFEEAKEKLKYADEIFLGDRPEVLDEDRESWKEICGRSLWEDMDMVMEFRAAGTYCVRMTVKVMDGETCRYERTEEIPLLNLAIHEDCRIGGEADGSRQTVLWYKNEGGEDE